MIRDEANILVHEYRWYSRPAPSHDQGRLCVDKQPCTDTSVFVVIASSGLFTPLNAALFVHRNFFGSQLPFYFMLTKTKIHSIFGGLITVQISMNVTCWRTGRSAELVRMWCTSGRRVRLV